MVLVFGLLSILLLLFHWYKSGCLFIFFVESIILVFLYLFMMLRIFDLVSIRVLVLNE